MGAERRTGIVLREDLEYLAELRDGTNTPSELAKRFHVTSPTVVERLNRLRRLGLVDVVLRDGRYTYYTTCLLYTSPSPRD